MKVVDHIVSLSKRESGQSLLETAIVLPVMLMLVFNAVNFGYYFYVALNVTSAPRTAALYSIQGGQTPGQAALPDVTSVQSLAAQDLTGSLTPAATAPMQVCSLALGVNSGGTTTQTAKCRKFPTSGSSTFPASGDVDPESPAFIAHRVDIAYTVAPIIPGSAFNLLLPSSMTFHRWATVRAMN